MYHWQWPGIHTTGVAAHSRFFRGHRSEPETAALKFQRQQNTQLEDEGQKKGLVLFFTGKRQFREAPSSSLFISEHTISDVHHQLLTGKSRPCFHPKGKECWPLRCSPWSPQSWAEGGTLLCRFIMDFSKVLGGALWWLHRMATALLARL